MKLVYRIETGHVAAWYVDAPIDLIVSEDHVLIDVPGSVAIPEAVVRVAQNEDPMFIISQTAIDFQWMAIKQQRQQKLLHTDWIFSVTDSVAPRKEAWGVYRQALRDITKQVNPFAIVWPMEPSDEVTAPSVEPVAEPMVEPVEPVVEPAAELSA